MKLYLVHCGFYDPEVCDGVYESHVNFFVVAASFEDARARAKQNPFFQKKRMHVDGLQELDAVDGYRLCLEQDSSLEGKTHIRSSRYRSNTPRGTGAKSSLH